MTQTNITKSRRNEIKEAVILSLAKQNYYELPVKIKYLARCHKNIRLISYSKHMKKMGISYKQMIEFANTMDACTDYYSEYNLYIIYYNDIEPSIVNSYRYRWNIAHELGHIFLKHHIIKDETRIFRSSLSQEQYKELEDEADYFAQLVLVPHATLWAIGVSTRQEIYSHCKISWPATWHRINEYKEWYKHIGKDNYDRQIFNYYYKYIYKKKCTNCNSGIVQRHGNYCPICGSKNTLQWGDGEMIYPKLQIRENGKLIECPVCKNEETEIEGDRCQICSANLVNHCSNNDCKYSTDLLPTNARYCPICGSNSLFYNSGFLKKWNYNDHSSLFSTIPDEELPFN